MGLFKISEELDNSIVDTWIHSEDVMGSEALLEEMFDQQPVLAFRVHVILAMLDDGEVEEEWADGMIKGILQTWHLFNQQAILNELNGETND